MDHQRRRVLISSVTAAGAAALSLPSRGVETGGSKGVDVHIQLHAVPDEVAIRPGAKTRVWRYRGKLLIGPAGTLEGSTDRYLGPIIRVRQGQRVRIDLINGLPESTIIHWHGLHVPEEMDGHPRFAIAPGERYVYEFKVVNRAGSYWFHPHPHGRTGKQVYFGMAGLFLITDDEEAALDLPHGAHDLPLVLQDRNFDDNNQLVYLSDSPSISGEPAPRRRGMMGGGMMRGGGMGAMMSRMMGVLGDEVLVNGMPSARIHVERTAYRLRVFNTSNTRLYKLAWSDKSALTVIGTDGGLLAAPLQRDYLMVAPAERVDLWVDFAAWPAGTNLTLRSLPFEGGMGMGGMMMGNANLPDGSAFPVMQFQIDKGTAVKQTVPQRLTTIAPPDTHLAVNANRPKEFALTMAMMAWGINGASFDMMAASSLETVRLGTQEVWEFQNDGQGSMMNMAMPHSMHVHGLQFRVIGRTIAGRSARHYNTVNAGFVDEGWKDTVLVMPGERVRILLRFEDYTGLFLYHCHMLEHEDAGLMRNYLVKA